MASPADHITPKDPAAWWPNIVKALIDQAFACGKTGDLSHAPEDRSEHQALATFTKFKDAAALLLKELAISLDIYMFDEWSSETQAALRNAVEELRLHSEYMHVLLKVHGGAEVEAKIPLPHPCDTDEGRCAKCEEMAITMLEAAKYVEEIGEEAPI